MEDKVAVVEIEITRVVYLEYATNYGATHVSL
ncbi:hypothetical protein PAE1429 [Pyrobaculum aerophilum str. IM2]|uniref:Uncharacterized protein n=1 Tax=Pyrobaculum aerophilum (strain ATCC 51768 / DSM 7523 / JCM 9630 / CIP 104966 / NBRC 100827 / IM2) TaxID=178306 RepID=Q8ZX70_PYRAE|nr:hypothetical protein PAE1429 [Pyrobaculum aerophilum str. IM2]